MHKNWVKKGLKTFGVLAVVFLIANFVLNFWLQYRLPHYIKNNTDYRIKYQHLDIDLVTGNIFVEGLEISNKNFADSSKIGIEGNVDTLKINRFGIYNALFQKKITTSELKLISPHLKITLSKPTARKENKKVNSLPFENLSVKNGNFSLETYNGERFFSVNNLTSSFKNIQIKESYKKTELPISFDEYSIVGQNIFYKPDGVYALHINKVSTDKSQLSISGLSLKSLISVQQFQKAYPINTQMYSVDIQELKLKNLLLNSSKIAIDSAHFIRPVVDVFKTNSIKNHHQKDFNLDILLKNLKIESLVLTVKEFNGAPMFSSKELNLECNDLKFSNKTLNKAIPIHFSNFNLKGKDIIYTKGNEVTISSIDINSKYAILNNILIESEGNSRLKINQLTSSFNKLKMIDDQLNIDVNRLAIDGVNGIFKQIKKPYGDKKSNFNGIQFPINVNNLFVTNSSAVFTTNDHPIICKNLNAHILNLGLQPNKNGEGIATTIKDYKISTDYLGFKSEFYQYTIGRSEISRNHLKVSEFSMLPLYSRAQFIKKIPVEKDLYSIKASKIEALGDWDLFSAQKNVHANLVELNGVEASIFRSKIPLDDPKIKLLYSALLRKIKFPLFIKHLAVKNSYLDYEEDTPKSSGPGKLSFSQFNMDVKNLNSAKDKVKPTNVNISIDCRFMKSSPMAVQWNFDTADFSDKFFISGRVNDISANSLNSFIVPYLSVSATGNIQEMTFNFKGNPKNISGSFNLKHQDLKVAILDRESREKRKFLSAIANLFIKSNSARFPESVAVENVERDETKSFFNLLWRGLQDGLKKTLIGKGSNKTESKLKKASNSIKETKSSIKETKKSFKKSKEKWREIKSNLRNDNSQKMEDHRQTD